MSAPTPAPAAPLVLAFSDRTSERCPVSTDAGVVAFVDAHGSDFQVVTPDAAVVCRGGTVPRSFGRRWQVTDPQGEDVLTLTGWGRSTDIRLADGRELRATGAMLSRHWTVTGGGDAVVVRTVAADSASLGFHPRSWLLEQDGSLSWLQFVAVVQVRRQAEQRRRRFTENLPI